MAQLRLGIFRLARRQQPASDARRGEIGASMALTRARSAVIPAYHLCAQRDDVSAFAE